MVPNLTTLALTIPVLPTIASSTLAAMALAISIAPVASITGSASPGVNASYSARSDEHTDCMRERLQCWWLHHKFSLPGPCCCGVRAALKKVVPKAVMYGGSPTDRVLAATVPVVSVFTAPVANLAAPIAVDFSLDGFAPDLVTFPTPL